jgi:hypothetical protein
MAAPDTHQEKSADEILGDFADCVSQVFASNEPVPTHVEVSPPAAVMLEALNEAHERGDQRTVTAIGEAALRELMRIHHGGE